MFTDTETASDASYAHADCHWNAESYSLPQTDSTPTTDAIHAHADCHRNTESYSHSNRFAHGNTEAAPDAITPHQ
jgi:hypothetical protein